MNIPYFLGWCVYRALYQFYFRWRVYNPERVPLEGGVILASNHASYPGPAPGGLGHAARHQLPGAGESVPLPGHGLGLAPVAGRCRWIAMAAGRRD